MHRALDGIADDLQLRTRTSRSGRTMEPAPAQPRDVTRAPTPSHGDNGSAGRTIGALQRSAGNAAVVQLLANRSPGTATSIQRESDEDEQLASEVEPSGQMDAAEVAGEDADQVAGQVAADVAGEDGATELDAGTAAPAAGAGQSWTRVGPPSDSTYTVTGTLRKASEAVAARPEAGSVTTTPSLDTDPPVASKGGTQVVPAARVTATQARELPDWSSREGPASNGGKPTANQVTEWDRFAKAIAKHEAGHVAKDVAAYANAHTQIKGKSPGDGDAEFDRITNQATADNEAYDTANDHGRKEGTTINPNIDEVTKVP
jgi:hypothetical protein